MTKIRAAIIGCGTIFPMHALSIKQLSEVELVAVCDVLKERAEKKGLEFSVPFYTDYKEMIEKEKPQSVHVCLPHYLHVPVSLYCMEKGIHVICEKPMATTLEDGELLLETAKKNSVVYACVLQCRFRKSCLFVKKALDDGKLGKVKGAKCYVTWNRSQAYYDEAPWRGKLYEGGGGVLINQAIHTVDMMCYLVGERVSRIDATVATRGKSQVEVEDTVEGILEFENGVFANFHAINYYSTNSSVYIELDCEKGLVKIFASSAVIEYKDGTVDTVDESGERQYEYEGVKSYWGTCHGSQIADFYNHIITGEPMYIPATAALETHKIICGIYSSGRKKLK